MADQNSNDEENYKSTSKEKQSNLWNEILSEVSEKTTNKIPANKRLLVLGDDVTGKTTLVSKLRSPGEAEIKKGAGLEYTYVDIHDVELDQHARLGVWILDGDPYHKALLKYTFTAETAKNVFVVIVVDMSRPWTIMESLERWMRILTEHLHSLKMSSKELNEMEAKLVKQYQSYIDPEDITDDVKHGSRTQSHLGKEEPSEVLPLDGSILSVNLGLPIAVVCTKTDAMQTLEKERDYKEEHFDFIQKNIRSFCLKYGAALLYTSVKDGCNLNVFYNYLQHRIYNFSLKHYPQVVEKDTIFIPMGWDNEKKIGILDEHIKSFNPTDQFDEHITKPPQRKATNQEKEVVAIDEQTFLAAEEVNLSKAPTVSQSMPRPQQQEHMRPRMPSPGQRLGAKAGNIPLAAKTKLDAAKIPGNPAAAGGEGVLANFFNSLLNKKGTGKVGSPTAGDRATVRSDAAAELERMSRAKKDAAVKSENPESGS